LVGHPGKLAAADHRDQGALPYLAVRTRPAYGRQWSGWRTRHGNHRVMAAERGI
jgi:hypothetical protein